MSMTVVDIVTPYSPKHTSEQLLERAKESVEKQSIETNHIIIEDKSQRGPAWARNKGLEKSENRFVAFLDADDYWKKDKLEKQLTQTQSETAGISVTDTVNQDGENALPTFRGNKIQSEDSFISQLILGRITSVTSSILIDTEKVEAERFDESYYRFEDHEYIFRCFNDSGLTVVPDELVVIEKTGSGLSENTETIPQIESRIKLLKEKQTSLDERFSGCFDHALAVQYRWLAREQLRHGDAEDLVEIYCKSVSRKPLLKTFAAMAIDFPRGVLA